MSRKSTKFAAAIAVSAVVGFAPISAAVAADGDAPPSKAAEEVGNTSQCQSDPMMGTYYRTWRDVTVPGDANSNLPYDNVIAMDELPNGVDLAMVFDAGDTADTDYWDTLRDTYVPALHNRGTSVVYSLGINKLAEADIPLEESAYKEYAQELVDTYMTPYSLDGLDIDVESYPRGDDLTRAIGIFNALGELIGPNSGSGHLFLYDTNQTGSTDLFQAVNENISFVLLQAYGRSVSSLQGTWDTFSSSIAPCQFLIGFSFPEEQSPTNWDDADGPFSEESFEASRARAYALWQPEEGTKGGIFEYAVDRDGKTYGDDTITPTDFAWTKALIAAQDEAAGVEEPDPGDANSDTESNGSADDSSGTEADSDNSTDGSDDADGDNSGEAGDSDSAEDGSNSDADTDESGSNAQAASDGEEAGSDGDQAGSDGDQAGSDGEETGSDGDQASSDGDEAGPDQDQADSSAEGNEAEASAEAGTADSNGADDQAAADETGSNTNMAANTGADTSASASAGANTGANAGADQADPSGAQASDQLAHTGTGPAAAIVAGLFVAAGAGLVLRRRPVASR